MTNDKIIELCRKHGWTVCTETTDIYMMGPATRFDVELRDEQGRLLVQGDKYADNQEYGENTNDSNDSNN